MNETTDKDRRILLTVLAIGFIASSITRGGKQMCDSMIFPATVDEFMEQYKIIDSDHVYTNGAEMVPIFRMKQWFEHEALMKPPKSLLDHIHNVVRDEAYKRGYEQGKADVQPEVTDEQIEDYCRKRCLTVVTNEFMHEVHKMASTVPPKHGKWNKAYWKAFRCSVCNMLSEYDTNFCPNCGAYMRGELFMKEVVK